MDETTTIRSRPTEILLRIGRLALLLQVVYLGAYVGWCLVDRSVGAAVPRQPTALESVADRLFAPIEHLGHEMMTVGGEEPSVEEQIREARIKLEAMGHRTR